MELHQEIGEALAHIVDDQEKKNIMLKRRVVELEVTLSLRPLFIELMLIVDSMEEYLVQA